MYTVTRTTYLYPNSRSAPQQSATNGRVDITSAAERLASAFNNVLAHDSTPPALQTARFEPSRTTNLNYYAPPRLAPAYTPQSRAPSALATQSLALVPTSTRRSMPNTPARRTYVVPSVLASNKASSIPSTPHSAASSVISRTSSALTKRSTQSVALSAKSAASTASVVPRPLLPLVPRPVKLLLLLVLLANYKSLPGYWTLRTNLPTLTLHARRHAFLVYVRMSLLVLRAARALRQGAVNASRTQLARKLKVPELAAYDSDGPQVLKLGLPGARWGWMQSLGSPNFALSPLDARSVRTTWNSYVGLDDCAFMRGPKGMRLKMGKVAYSKNLDYALSDFVSKRLAPFLADGGRVELVQSEIEWDVGRSIGWWNRYEIWVDIDEMDDLTIRLSAKLVTRKTAADKQNDLAAPVSGDQPAEEVKEEVRGRTDEETKAKIDAAVAETEKGVKGYATSRLNQVQDMSSSFTTAAEFTDALEATPSTSSELDTDFESASDEVEAAKEVELEAKHDQPSETTDALQLETASEAGTIALDGPINESSSRIEVEDASVRLGDDDEDYDVHVVSFARYGFRYGHEQDSPIPPALVLAACGFGHFDAIKALAGSERRKSKSREASSSTDMPLSSTSSSSSATTWERLQRIRYAGAPDDLHKFWSGGWAGSNQVWKQEVSSWQH
ncbi:hypothetical protein BKA62DRAFT_827581 [Auriculariales sp. MPI-PUGE-AT-0066]|nr:hypothetical protein BKA62DRAFT_827581 [Auriculariales sp. MPI-PUGE-AT-0066]